jgi:hypothetical protein
VHVGVSDQMVRNYRRQIDATPKVLKSTKRKGRDGRTINVAKIGKTPDTAPPPPPKSAAAAPARDTDSDNNSPASRGSGRTTRSQKIDRLARLTLSFIEATKHLAHLVGWLGETAGEFDQAALVLSNINDAVASVSAEIERKAVAADPLNASRLGIEENRS